jgi:hypothetical protein
MLGPPEYKAGVLTTQSMTLFCTEIICQSVQWISPVPETKIHNIKIIRKNYTYFMCPL